MNFKEGGSAKKSLKILVRVHKLKTIGANKTSNKSN